jgi:positive regulator of sigma E activity
MNQECRRDGYELTAVNSAGLRLAVGELVEIGASGAQTAGQAALVFLPPAAAFGLGYAGAALAFPASGDALRAAAGALAMAAGFVGVYFWRRGADDAARPVVLRKLAEPPAETGAGRDAAAELY